MIPTYQRSSPVDKAVRKVYLLMRQAVIKTTALTYKTVAARFFV